MKNEDEKYKWGIVSSFAFQGLESVCLSFILIWHGHGMISTPLRLGFVPISITSTNDCLTLSMKTAFRCAFFFAMRVGHKLDKRIFPTGKLNGCAYLLLYTCLTEHHQIMSDVNYFRAGTINRLEIRQHCPPVSLLDDRRLLAFPVPAHDPA